MERFVGLNLSILLILMNTGTRRNDMISNNTIAFTGSRLGMTDTQMVGIVENLIAYKPKFVKHGDCLGADAQFHELCLAYGKCQIIIHPPTNTTMRAYCKGAHVMTQPKPYLDRNKDMVIWSNLLIACPHEKKEVLRSGTWSTIRYARKTGTEVVIIYP